MRHGKAILAVIMTLLMLHSWRSNAIKPVVRILPLGDSITQGGRTDRKEYTYRLPLQRLLLKAGVNFDFLGSNNTGLDKTATWPDVVPGIPFDPDHEGHYGWKTAQVRDRLSQWLQLYPPPDIVLIHLGSNDQDAAKTATTEAEASRLYTQAIVNPLTDIINLLRKRNPRVVILMGHLNFNDGAAIKTRALVEAMTAQLSTVESPIVTVHHYRGFIAQPGPGSDTYDWAHPNPQGQQKMAVAWFNALQPYLDQ